jgi:hypothetical protein
LTAKYCKDLNVDKKVAVGLGVVGGAIALAVGGQAFASHMATKEIDSAIANVSELVTVDYKKVNASLLGRGTRVEDVSITPLGSTVPIQVDEVVVYKYDKKGEVPTYVSMAVNGMALPAAAAGEATPLQPLGYDKDLSVDFATEYQYQEKEQALQLKKFKVGAAEVGDLDLTLHLSNVPIDEGALDNYPMSLLGAVFHEAKLTYKDDSLVSRMFDTAAAAQGVSVDEFKKEAIANLETSLAAGEEGLSKELVKEITAFINNPDEFSLTMSPKEPVPFSSLMGVGGTDEMIELLNVKFKS